MTAFRSVRGVSLAAIMLATPMVAMAAPVNFDLPIQPLGASLQQVAITEGLTLVVNDDLLAGKSAPALKGSFEPQEALRRLLAGSGLASVVTNKSIVVTRQTGEIQLEKVSVQETGGNSAAFGTATAESGGMAVPKQSFGPLGDTAWQDIPFSTFSIPTTVIQDQQAHTPYEMLRNDPSVNIHFSPTFTATGDYIIRGSLLDAAGTRLDGLPIATGSAVNGFAVAPEGLERADVLAGAASVLYGFAAPAGVINFISKKPLDEPLTNVTLQYNSTANVEEALDVSRRFGKDDQFGVRLNVAQQDGNGAIDRTSGDRNLTAIAFDWKPIDNLRLWTNFQENVRNNNGSDPLFLVSNLKTIPSAPNLAKLYGQSWYHNDDTSLLGEGGLQYDNDGWHFSASGGVVNSQLDQLYDSNGGVNLQQSGRYTINAYFNPNVEQDGRSYNVQVSKEISIGDVVQTLGVNYTHSQLVFEDKGYGVLNSLGTSDFLNPVYISQPASRITSASARFKQETNSNTLLATDRIDFGKYVTLLGGADIASLRYQLAFNGVVGYGSSAQQSQVTPLVALQLHPVSWITPYFSYIQALEQGASAPTGAVNYGQTLPPYVGDQYEVGVKTDVNKRLQLGVDLYLINQQNAVLDPADDVYKAAGTARSEGVEFTVAGKIVDELRLIGGLTAQNAKVINPTSATAGTTTVAGVPDYRLTLFGEYAVDQVPGLTLIGGVYYTGSQAASATLSIPAYTTVDVGAKYDFILYGTPTTASFYVQNALDNRYWASAGSGELQLGTPLQASAAITVKF